MSSDILISTLARAIFWGAVADLATIELDAAISTGKGTAVIADLSARRARVKRGPTSHAFFNHADARHTARFKKVWIVFPDGIVCLCMTGWAERHQICEAVGFPVVIKQMKGLNMVNGEAAIADTAVLARIVVAFTCPGALLTPIWASIVNMTAKPTGVIFTRPCPRSSPLSPAVPIAEIVLSDLARLALNLASTGVASDGNTLAAHTQTVNTLPKPVAHSRAKAGIFYPIWFDIEWLSTLLTDDCYHGSIIAHLED